MAVLTWLRKKIAAEAVADTTPVANPVSHELRHTVSIKRQGDEHARAARFAEAEHCYRQVPESDADHPGALVMLGFVLREQGRIEEARGVLERAVGIARDDADGHYLLGTVLEAAGPQDSGLVHLRRAIELRPNFELARRQLIAALLRSNRSAEAMQLCDESLAILPQSSELHFCRSDLHAQAGDKASAITSCERALALNPGWIAAQQNLSRLLFETEQYERAEVSYRREIELTPQHYGPRHQLGVLFNRSKRSC